MTKRRHRPRQGDIWWADVPLGFGWRPVLVLSRDELCTGLNDLTVATITTQIRGWQTEVIVDRDDGLSERSAVTVNNLLVLDKNRLDRWLARLSIRRMDEVFAAVRYAFDMP